MTEECPLCVGIHWEYPLHCVKCALLLFRFDVHISKKWNGCGAAASVRDAFEGQKQLEVNQKVLMETKVKYEELKVANAQLRANQETVILENSELKQRVFILESKEASAVQLDTDKENLITENTGLKKRVHDLEELSVRLRSAAWHISEGSHSIPSIITLPHALREH